MMDLVVSLLAAARAARGPQWPDTVAIVWPSCASHAKAFQKPGSDVNTWILPTHTADHWALLVVRRLCRKGPDPSLDATLLDPQPSSRMLVAAHDALHALAAALGWGDGHKCRRVQLPTQLDVWSCGPRAALHASQALAVPASRQLSGNDFTDFAHPGESVSLSVLSRDAYLLRQSIVAEPTLGYARFPSARGRANPCFFVALGAYLRVSEEHLRRAATTVLAALHMLDVPELRSMCEVGAPTSAPHLVAYASLLERALPGGIVVHHVPSEEHGLFPPKGDPLVLTARAAGCWRSGGP